MRKRETSLVSWMRFAGVLKEGGDVRSSTSSLGSDGLAMAAEGDVQCVTTSLNFLIYPRMLG